jgi:hypothetical protein
MGADREEIRAAAVKGEWRVGVWLASLLTIGYSLLTIRLRKRD